MTEISVPWLQEVLALHDPLAAWSSQSRSADADYRQEAELAAHALRHLEGLGHARTLVADVLDSLHPGLYQALAAGDPALERRLNLVAREIWDMHGVVPKVGPAAPQSPEGGGSGVDVPAPPVPASELIANSEELTAWLRAVEDILLDLVTGSSSPETAPSFQAALPAILDEYAIASDQKRAAARTSFSRFRLVRYQLSAFAIVQFREVAGSRRAEAVRLALMAESLLDGGLDWRDELLLLRDLRREALQAGVPFSEILQDAAECSSPQTRAALLSLLNEG